MDLHPVLPSPRPLAGSYQGCSLVDHPGFTVVKLVTPASGDKTPGQGHCSGFPIGCNHVRTAMPGGSLVLYQLSPDGAATMAPPRWQFIEN